MAQKERENFYRNSTVIVDHGKESMSAIIDNDLSNRNMTFEDFINRHQHDIYHLCYNKFPCCQCPVGRFVPANKNRILYPGQLDILLDTSGSTLNGHNPNTSTTSQHCCRPAKKFLSTSNLDITLLRCLLMNFAQNCRTNSVLRQDVEDLVKCRNKMYGHAKEARLSDSDYSKYKTDVEGIILRIARFCNIENEMRQKLYDASQRPLDESILLQYTKTLIEQSVYEKNIVEKVDELQQQMTLKEERLHCRMDIMEGKVSEVGHRKRNIIAHTEARLLEHSKDDTYTVTEDVKSCCDILEKYKTLVIIAKAGGGKSKTCLQIATMFQDISFTPMLFVNDEISRNRDLINFDDKNIVIVEDLFGRSNIEFNEDLHTEAVRILEETYITKKCSLSDRGKCKGSKLSDIYVLQHNTVQEAILVSYGDDVDVLPYCDLGFLYEYIRPKGYEDSLDEQMVFLFCDYKHIATKLISMLSTDDITFTIVGFYLELVALLHRRDEIINFFFQNLEDVKPNEYACLVNGLTGFGKNPALVKFHPNLCKEILIHAGMTVFRAFCRPIGWTENDTNFVEIETDLLMKKLYFIIDTSRLKENCQELEENKGGVHYFFNLFESNGSRYNVGNYVFKKSHSKRVSEYCRILI